jgi:hypothetical protein
MFDDVAAVSGRDRVADFKRTIDGLTFHPADVPTFDVVDVCDLFRDLLVDAMGWDVINSHTVEWGDSSTRARWVVYVSPLAQIVVERYEGVARTLRVSFEGSWRDITPAALAYLAGNLS